MSSPSAQYRPARFNSFILLALLAASTQYTFSQSSQYDTKIGNFGQVNENYYRGAQPDASDFQALRKMGVKTVIDLQKDGMFQEASWVENAGMRYYKIPLSSTKPATAEQTEYFLKLVNDPTNWPVYVHCAGGRHRTGEMTAVYRITHDAWDADRAFSEMKQYGYYSFPNHGSLKTYVYRYFQDRQNTVKKQPVPAPAPETVATPAVLPVAN